MCSREDTSSGSTNLHIYAPADKQGNKRGKKVSNDVHKITCGFYYYDRRGNISVDRKNRPIIEKKPRTYGEPRISWLEDNLLSPASHPVPFMKSMLYSKSTPDEKRRRRNQSKFSIFND